MKAWISSATFVLYVSITEFCVVICQLLLDESPLLVFVHPESRTVKEAMITWKASVCLVVTVSVEVTGIGLCCPWILSSIRQWCVLSRAGVAWHKAVECTRLSPESCGSASLAVFSAVSNRWWCFYWNFGSKYWRITSTGFGALGTFCESPATWFVLLAVSTIISNTCWWCFIGNLMIWQENVEGESTEFNDDGYLIGNFDVARRYNRKFKGMHALFCVFVNSEVYNIDRILVYCDGIINVTAHHYVALRDVTG